MLIKFYNFDKNTIKYFKKKNRLNHGEENFISQQNEELLLEQSCGGVRPMCAHAEVLILLFKSLCRGHNDNDWGHVWACFQSLSQT